MLETTPSVIRALLTYTDWWQPTTTSIMRFTGTRRRSDERDGFREGLLDTLPERTEICRRRMFLSERERHILFLWYVVQQPVTDIARTVRVSQRQCFRLRSRAIKRRLELPEPDQ